MTEPTHDELAKLFTEETGFDVDEFPAAILDYACAVLAKWGSPPAVAAEPVAWYEYNADIDAWFLAYSHNPKAKTRPLVFGDTTPQPTQAQAGAVPLSAAQKQQIHNETGAGHALICLVESYLLEAHGIKGGQHGTS